MSQKLDGVKQIQKVLDMFKIDYQNNKTFDQLRYGEFDALFPVDFALEINHQTAVIEYFDESIDPQQVEQLISYVQKYGIPFLAIDHRDDDQIQAVVSKFIDAIRTNDHQMTQEYAEYSKGYFFKKVAVTADTKDSNKKLDAVNNSALATENEQLKQELENYQALISDFTKQVKQLNEMVLKNSQKILAIQSGEITPKFEGDFRLHGSKTGHLTEPAKRLVLVVTMNLECNWTEIQRYFKDNYDESISISTIKRIYQRDKNDK